MRGRSLRLKGGVSAILRGDDYRDDINCVHIGNKGSVFISRQQM